MITRLALRTTVLGTAIHRAMATATELSLSDSEEESKSYGIEGEVKKCCGDFGRTMIEF
jgi:hypothetical protein